MSGPIIITGRDIIGWDGTDRTGALAELGVSFTPPKGGGLDTAVAAMRFQVDLDFVLRHDLLDSIIYQEHYKGSPRYQQHYGEGRDAFLAGKPEDPPYEDSANESIYLRHYPWYDGYRETRKRVANEKYRLSAMKDRIRAIVAEHGCKIEYTDEYGTPYAVTPEGYNVELA